MDAKPEERTAEDTLELALRLGYEEHGVAIRKSWRGVRILSQPLGIDAERERSTSRGLFDSLPSMSTGKEVA